MKEVVAMTKKEAIEINGGDAYTAGYLTGKFVADVVDWFEGFADGFNKAFSKK